MKSKFKFAFQIISMLLPFALRRVVLNLCGHEIHRDARIGFSLILVDRIELGEYAHIGHLNFISGLKTVRLEEHALVGNLNWITGRMSVCNHGAKRSLLLKEGAAITNRHYIDCNGSIILFRFCTFAGVRSQIFTHSINMRDGIQSIRDVNIGAYSFVGTGSIVLPGATVPNHSIVAAGSVVRPGLDPGRAGIYAGNPAVIEKSIEVSQYKFMTRAESKVNL